MNKKMRSLLGKGIIIMGSATLLLSPVYADNTVAESTPIASSQEEVQNSKVSSEFKEYDLNYQIQYRFIPVDIELNGNELVGISNEGQPLVKDRDYQIREYKNDKMVVEIDLNYMARQEVGDLNLTFEFNKGEAQVLMIKVTDETEAELSNLTGEYDRAKAKPGYGYGVGTVLKDNKDSLKGMYIQGKNGEPERELEYQKDYIVTCTMVDMGIWFTEDFLNSLPMGENEIIFRFKYAEPKTFVVNVIDTGKETSTLKLDLDKSTAPSSNTIINSFKVAVGGEESYDLSKLKIRYYYTADEANEQNAVVDNAEISYIEAPWYEGITSNVESKIVKMEKPTATADTYLEISFTSEAVLNNKSTMAVDTRIHKADWSNYDQSNDFSYNDASKVAVFYDDELIAGEMPQ